MKKKIFEISETILIAALLLIPTVLFFAVLAELRVAIDQIMVTLNGKYLVFYNFSIGDIFYIVVSIIVTISVLGYIIAMPDTDELGLSEDDYKKLDNL